MLLTSSKKLSVHFVLLKIEQLKQWPSYIDEVETMARSKNNAIHLNYSTFLKCDNIINQLK